MKGGVIMRSFKEIIFKYPVISSIIISSILISLTFIPLDSIMPSTMDSQLADYLGGITKQVLVSIILIIMLKKLSLFHKCRFSFSLKDTYLIWPIALYCILSFINIFTGEIIIDTSRPFVIVGFILVYLSTGLFEEILCRGLIFSLIDFKWGKRGYILPVILSSLLFGASHFIHYFLGDASAVASIAQVIYATFIGVFFAAIVIRRESIYPAIIWHGIFDIAFDLKEIAVGGGIFKGYMDMSIEQAIKCDIIMLPLFVYGLSIIRNELIKK